MNKIVKWTSMAVCVLFMATAFSGLEGETTDVNKAPALGQELVDDNDWVKWLDVHGTSHLSTGYQGCEGANGNVHIGYWEREDNPLWKLRMSAKETRVTYPGDITIFRDITPIFMADTSHRDQSGSFEIYFDANGYANIALKPAGGFWAEPQTLISSNRNSKFSNAIRIGNSDKDYNDFVDPDTGVVNPIAAENYLLGAIRFKHHPKTDDREAHYDFEGCVGLNKDGDGLDWLSLTGGSGGDSDWLPSDATNDEEIHHMGNVGIGVEDPETKLDVGGTVQMKGFKMDTTAKAGYVLTTDEDGEGTWKECAATGFPHPKFDSGWEKIGDDRLWNHEKRIWMPSGTVIEASEAYFRRYLLDDLTPVVNDLEALIPLRKGEDENEDEYYESLNLVVSIAVRDSEGFLHNIGEGGIFCGGHNSGNYGVYYAGLGRDRNTQEVGITIIIGEEAWDQWNANYCYFRVRIWQIP